MKNPVFSEPSKAPVAARASGVVIECEPCSENDGSGTKCNKQLVFWRFKSKSEAPLFCRRARIRRGTYLFDRHAGVPFEVAKIIESFDATSPKTPNTLPEKS